MASERSLPDNSFDRVRPIFLLGVCPILSSSERNVLGNCSRWEAVGREGMRISVGLADRKDGVVKRARFW